ncbi:MULTISPECIES: hypothetical protein [Sphingobacterium]|uniref:hypothetical protein n=1 Tax=Sphingobacterium TaxID=28453 RepID=UPI00196A0228|nr:MULTISPECIES: hypothetical protein [unclassified Sphingobacterium]
MNGDSDVATPEHIVAMSRIIQDCRIAIIPGGHGEYIGEITTVQAGDQEDVFIASLLEKFLS